MAEVAQFGTILKCLDRYTDSELQSGLWENTDFTTSHFLRSIVNVIGEYINNLSTVLLFMFIFDVSQEVGEKI